LENVSRDTVYKQALKKASESRPKKAEEKQEITSPKKSPGGINSPLSDKAKELIFGVNNTSDSDSTQSKSKEDERKKSQLFEKAVDLYPVIMVLVMFLSDLYKVFDNGYIDELDFFLLLNTRVVVLIRWYNMQMGCLMIMQL
jgi:hypothetical protein